MKKLLLFSLILFSSISILAKPYPYILDEELEIEETSSKSSG